MPDPALPSAADQERARDPITGLRPMSRTAGLGLHDYSAINTAAVVGLVLGLAGWLVVFGTALLVVPAAGLLFAILALRQIRRSSGTESGLLLAILGGLLSLGFLGYAVVTTVGEAARARTDRAQIDAAVREAGRDIAADNFDAAYALFHPRFHEVYSREVFEQTLRGLQKSRRYGKIEAMQAGDVLRFEQDRATGRRTGVGQIVATVKLADGTTAEARHMAVFWDDGGKWKILSLGDWFAKPQDQPIGGPAAGPPPPGAP